MNTFPPLQMVTEQDSEQGESLTELSDELEEELCKVWDMAMDKVSLITIDVEYRFNI